MSEAGNPKKISNRPGLSALSYRVGDYASFRQDLLAQLSQTLPSLKTRDSDDAAIALLDAWAIVADVLTFYQERIANEGYLKTVTETQSIIELARLIGYELKPGVSASTYLAFTIEDKPGGSPLVTISKGTQVMSIPAEGESPQLFETSKDVVADPNWNALQPRLGKPQQIIDSTRQLYLVGIKTQLAAGDWVLLTGKEDETPQEFPLELKTVKLLPELNSTLIIWDHNLAIYPKNYLRNPELFAFRQQARLFGNNAPRWQDTPNDLKRKSPGVQLQGGVFVTSNSEKDIKNIKWISNSFGLPNQDILCLAVGEKLLFAGTDGSGVFRGEKVNQAWNWQMINSGLTNLNVQSLLVIDKAKGHLLAGTASGGVFRSKDNGENWSPLGFGNIRLEKDSQDTTKTVTVNTGIPNVVVRSLLTYDIGDDIGETSFIFAGTDDDIYRTTNQGQDWSSSKIPSNLNSQNYKFLNGLPNRVIYALLCIPETPDIIRGTITSVDPAQKQITVAGLPKRTLIPGDLITVKGQTRKIEKITTATIKLDQTYGTNVVKGTSFIANNITGIIDNITTNNNKEINIIQVGYLPQKGDKITAAGQTQNITNVRDVSITATLKLDSLFEQNTPLETEFISSEITGKINSIDGQTIKITQASGILKPGDQITAAQQTKIIAEVIEYAITATVELEEAFQPSFVKGKTFNTSNQSTGANQSTGTIEDIPNISQGQIIVNNIKGVVQVGDSFTSEDKTRTISKIESCTLILDQNFNTNVQGENLTNVRIFAGTDKGIYYSDDYGLNWNPRSGDIADKIVYSLAYYKITDNNQPPQNRDKYYILAGTNNGVWLSEVGTSLNWEKVDKNNIALSGQSVRSLGVLTVTNKNYIFAATGEGIFRGEQQVNNSWTWYKTEDNPIVKKITSIAVINDQEKQVLAGAKFSGFTQEKKLSDYNSFISPQEQTEWANFYPENNQIYLDTLYPKILPDSRLLLVNKSEELQNITSTFSAKVEQVFSEQYQAFTLDTKVTRIKSDLDIKNGEKFNPRSTIVFAQSESLPLAEISLTVPVQQENIFQDPISTNKILLGKYVHGLEAKKNVIVSGKHIRAKVNVGGIFRSRNWQLLQSNLDTKNIQSIAFREADGKLFALTEEGILSSEDQGKTWQIITTEKPDNANITCLAIYSKPIHSSLNSYQNSLWAKQTGSASSPFVNLELGDTITIAKRIQIGDTSVLSKQTRIIKTTATKDPPFRVKIDKNLTIDVHYDTEENTVNKLFVGTEKGIYRFQEENTPAWELIPDDSIKNVQVLLVNPFDNSIVAGTKDQGVFISKDGGKTWSEPALTKENIITLAADKNTGHVFAGTEKNGVFHYNGINWQPLNKDITDLHIVSLAIDSKSLPNNGFLYAGTDDSGVFQLSLGNIPLGNIPLANTNYNWKPINKNLPDLHILNLFVDSTNNYLFASTKERGVFRKSLDREVWESVNVGLSDRTVQSLIKAQFNSEAIILAGTSEGLFNWVKAGKIGSEIYWEHSNQGLIYNNVQTLVSHRFKGILYLFAGTKSGVFRSLDQGQTWELRIQGLKNTNIQKLLVFEYEDKSTTKMKIIAGTQQGLFYSTDQALSWETIKLGKVDINIQALAMGKYNDKDNNKDNVKDFLFAGTLNDGVFHSSDNGVTWIGIGLTKQDIQVILSQDGNLLVGTAGNGIFYSNNNGKTWEHWTDTRPGTGTISSNGIIVTGENTKFLTELKPGDKIESDGQIRTVVSMETQLTVDSAFPIAFQLTSPIIYKDTDILLGSGTISRDGLTVNGSNTEFLTKLNIGDSIKANDQTRTVVDIQSNKLTVDTPFKPVLTEKPFTVYTGLENLYIKALAVFNGYLVAGTAGSGVFWTKDNGKHWESINTTIVDQKQLPDLEIRCFTVDNKKEYLWMGTATGGVFRLKKGSDHWETVSAGLTNTEGLTNTDVREILIEDANLYIGGIGILPSLDGLNFVELQFDDLLRVVTAPNISKDSSEWQVVNRNNFQGKLITTSEHDINLLPAAEEDPLVSEMAVIKSPPDDEDLPLLTLENNLKYSYDPATVKIYANVVEASHGETISEILGTGSGALANQRFILSKPPLTHIAAATPSGGDSELTVYVNDVEWKEVPSLYDLDKQDHSYILRIEDDGTTSITFGDGYRGARLPSGRENITATYRSGLGLGGNVEPEKITLKKTGPPSIKGVTNPLRATGGAESESLESARTTVPTTTRTLGRIVSRQDFEDFTQAFAGIGKAQAVPLWNGTTELLQITIAGIGGQPVLPESALYQSLVNAINLARDPVQQVQISSFEALFFEIEAKVKLETGYQVAIVETAIRQKLLETFAFEKRVFGQSVTQSEVIAAIGSVMGVQAVDLDFFHRQDASRTLQQFIPASPAFWDFTKNQVQPAQLLMLNPKNITLAVGENL